MDFDKHSKLSKQIRHACSVEESKYLESEFIDDLVLAVGRVIVDFDMENSQ